MGLLRNEVLVEQLIKHGRSGDTPIAVIENGTLPEQRVVTGHLKQLPSLVKEHDIVSPSLIVIGEVAALARKLGWFKQSTLVDAQSEHYKEQIKEAV